MKLTLRTAPAALPVTTTEILDHLRIKDSSPPDLSDITRIAEGCVTEVQNKLRRALMPQAWTLWLNGFPPCIRVPLPPLIEVQSIRYLDPDNVWQTLSADKYRVIFGGEDRSEIIAAFQESWPATANTLACVEVRFVCGYDAGGSPPMEFPADIVNALLELIAFRYAVSDGTAFASDRILDELPAGRALQRYRVFA